MFYSLCYLFLEFMFFSIIGYLAEISYVSLKTKKINISRGFLIGPYLPIYGVSSVVMVLLLSRYQDDLFTLFVMGAFICTFLEYMTSFILEKIFKLRWWDYSSKKFNIEGRVCLENSLLFGLGGLLIVKILDPFLEKYLNLLTPFALQTLAIICFIVFLSDFAISLFILIRLGINVNKFAKSDATSEIKKEVRASLEKYTTLTLRLVKSFPSLKYPNSKAFDAFKQTLIKRKESLKHLKEKVDNKIDCEIAEVENKIDKIEKKMEKNLKNKDEQEI